MLFPLFTPYICLFFILCLWLFGLVVPKGGEVVDCIHTFLFTNFTTLLWWWWYDLTLLLAIVFIPFQVYLKRNIYSQAPPNAPNGNQSLASSKPKKKRLLEIGGATWRSRYEEFCLFTCPTPYWVAFVFDWCF